MEPREKYNSPVDEIDHEQLLCCHSSFVVRNKVRYDNNGKAYLEVEVRCDQCGLPFSFNGLNVGAAGKGAAISADGTKLRICISPGIGGIRMKKE